MIHIGPLHHRVSATDLGALAAPLQSVPTRHQAYFGDDVAEIAAEIHELPDWRAHTTVATDGDELVGWLVAERDDTVGRVWWWGPVVTSTHDWREVAEPLLDTAIEHIEERFGQFKFAVDARHADAIELAERRSYRRGTGSVVLERGVLTGRESTSSHRSRRDRAAVRRRCGRRRQGARPIVPPRPPHGKPTRVHP